MSLSIEGRHALLGHRTNKSLEELLSVFKPVLSRVAGPKLSEGIVTAS